MKQAFRLLLFLAATLASNVHGLAQQRCGAVRYDSLRQAADPAYRRGRELLEKLIREDNAARRAGRVSGVTADTLLVIPVVVHVIHNTQGGGIGGPGNQNISDGQIRSQMDVLNEDYRRLNADRSDTPAEYASVAADLNIQFRLADKDPNGQATTGITRHYSQKTIFSLSEMDELGDIVSWPNNRYLNIWVVGGLEGNFLGYAQFPNANYPPSLPGIDNFNGQDKSDGVMVTYRSFGRTGELSKTYDLGRTATHEIGHWLGLLHTWGNHDYDQCRCGDSDYIADTPEAECANTDECLPIFSNCNGRRTRNMIENYMDYSPDACMNLFTGNQSDRIRQVLALSPRRKELLENLRTQLPASNTLAIAKVYNNPFYASQSDSKPLRLDVLLKGRQDVTVDVFDQTGRLTGSQLFTQTQSNSLAVNLNGLPQGFYVVCVRTTTEIQVRKVVVLP